MHNLKLIAALSLLLLVLCGCQKTTVREEGTKEVPSEQTTAARETQSTVAQTEDQVITVDAAQFTVEQINEQIKEAINSDMYYSGYFTDSDNIFSNRDLLLNQPLEYALYYVTTTGPRKLSPAEIRVLITNHEHPLSASLGKQYLYEIAFFINENGLEYYCQTRHTAADAEPTGTFLGNYTMCFTEFTKPQHEVMSEEWKAQAKAALALYMDQNDFNAYDKRNLPAGNYRVYIKGFYKSDYDSTIIFQREDGLIYSGRYLFLHTISEGNPADLHRVEFLGYADNMTQYLERVRENCAFSMEYTVKETAANLPLLPSMHSFSGTELAGGSRILSATLKSDIFEEVIEPGDPRLIRLLNYLLYSEEQGQTAHTQSDLKEDEILMGTRTPVLDITLQPGTEETGLLGSCSHILISEGYYLLIVDQTDQPEGHSGLSAEKYYPFGKLVSGREDLSNRDDWIDFLEYAEIVNSNDLPLR